jgi:ubiquinone/menaquinone biosynthesis C-methylase UbiE
MYLPPRLYDLVQVLLGMRTSLARLSPHLAALDGGVVVDVGGGTGLYQQHLPATTTCVSLDTDWKKLARARAERPRGRLVSCDATRISLADKSVDYAICIGVAHHLDDAAFRLALREMARVVRRRLIFVDPVRQSRWSFAQLLWALDDGRHPRYEAALLDAIGAEFVCEHVESYRIHHRYLMCVGVPRSTTR